MTRVTFHNHRGQKLAGFFYDTPQSTKMVIVCHGFTGSKEGGGRALEMAEEISRLGWGVLLFDFAGNGESEGSFEDLTLSGQIEDLTGAVNWSINCGWTRIVTLGRSFGGVTAICQAARDSRISGVCTWSTPASLSKLFLNLANGFQDQDRVAISGPKGTVYLKKNFFEDLKRYDVLADASRICPRPFLIIHGLKDAVVHPDNAARLYQSAGEPKKLVWIEEGDHQFTQSYRQAWEAFLQWLGGLNR